MHVKCLVLVNRKKLKEYIWSFVRKYLCVKWIPPTTAVYGELGRYPLYSSRYVRILKYWLRLIQTDNIIMQTVYKISYEDCLKGKKNWVSIVKKLPYDYGFNYVFDNQTVVNEVVFLSMFKQRILIIIINHIYIALFSYIGIRSKVLYNFKGIIMNDTHVKKEQSSKT